VFGREAAYNGFVRGLWSCLFFVAACGSDRVLPAQDAPPAESEPPTYHRDIAPLIARQCETCHREGGVGPFALETYTQAADVADAAAAMTATRQMPPWPADASGACNTFVGQRWLTDADIAMFAAWAAAGAPEGDPAQAVEIEVPGDLPFAGSVTLQSAEAYTVMPGPDDRYRCFVVDPQLTQPAYITAFAMRLDRADVVHHMQLYSADTEEAEADIAARDAADAEPGYACEDGVGNVRYIGVWAAGDRIKRWPDGTGIRIGRERNLVVQLHYHNHSSGPIADRSAVELELASAVDKAGRIDSYAQRDLRLVPGEEQIVVSREIEISRTAIARGARLHMHQLGVTAKLELIHEGQTQCMLDIPRWNFGWQLFYDFDQPMAVATGDVLELTCSYDTRSRTDVVTWGESTTDEMCIGYLYVTP
jgi:hypothetical protein